MEPCCRNSCLLRQFVTDKLCRFWYKLLHLQTQTSVCKNLCINFAGQLTLDWLFAVALVHYDSLVVGERNMYIVCGELLLCLGTTVITVCGCWHKNKIWTLKIVSYFKKNNFKLEDFLQKKNRKFEICSVCNGPSSFCWPTFDFGVHCLFF